MREYDLVVRNGTVVDGTGVPRYRADVGVRGGRIARITGRLAGRGEREIDATGLIVAPGAVDLHTHYDAQVNWDPYCTLSGWHGVTSLTIGQCGFGFAPCRPEDREITMRMMERIEAIPMRSMELGLHWDWESFPEYLASLERHGLGLNVASLVPYSPLRSYVLGPKAARERTSVTPAELAEIRRLFREGMAAGAFGFSADLNLIDRPEDGSHLPTHVASREEYLALATELGRCGVGHIGWTIGIGADADGRDPLLDELVRVSGRPGHWDSVAPLAHLPGLWRKQLAWLEEMHAEGHALYAQAIAMDSDAVFTLAEFNMFDDLPAWVDPLVGTAAERAAKLARPEARAAMKRDLVEVDACRFHKDFAKVKVARAALPANRVYDGMTIAELAEVRGAAHPLDAMLDLAIEEEMATEFAILDFVNSGNLEATAEILKHPLTHFSVSDGGAHVRYLTIATWPTHFLTFWVRDRGLMSLEQAHYKMSALPAWIAGFRDRGVLREGMAADLVVYDFEGLCYREDGPVFAHDFPGGEPRIVRHADGWRHTIVNGVETFADGECTGALPGRLLRSTDPAPGAP